MYQPHFLNSMYDTYSQGAADERMTLNVSADRASRDVSLHVVAHRSVVGCSLRLTRDEAETLRDMLSEALASQRVEVAA